MFLLKFLENRVGTLPAEAPSRILSADTATLKLWEDGPCRRRT